MSKWISVEERFPEKGGRYLVCSRDLEDEYREPCIQVARWSTYFNKNGMWKGHQAYSEILKVTHWCELPEPPKEGE